jgi:NAD-dependent dihydropyrimidine dehydrogenase PreA subunit
MTMLRYLDNVVTLQLDPKLCFGCGMCANVCPHGVFNIEGRKAVIADKGACMECGACAINCPTKAIQVRTGVGCAAGLLMGALGKPNECSCACGASPEATGSENPKSGTGASCC